MLALILQVVSVWYIVIWSILYVGNKNASLAFLFDVITYWYFLILLPFQCFNRTKRKIFWASNSHVIRDFWKKLEDQKIFRFVRLKQKRTKFRERPGCKQLAKLKKINENVKYWRGLFWAMYVCLTSDRKLNFYIQNWAFLWWK